MYDWVSSEELAVINIGLKVAENKFSPW